MSTFLKIGTGTLLFFAGSLLLCAAQTPTQEYKLKSGKIVYSIHGGGVLAPDLNLTIVGEGVLRFRDWGKRALVEEEVEESTSGALRNTEKFSTCVKYDEKQEFNVDYDKEVIRERALPKGRGLLNMKEGMRKDGKDMIAGKRCDVWTKKGVRICLYKGIPLLIEKELFGISYEKKALAVEENIDISTEECNIPNFPTQKIALFKTSIKQKKGPEEISKYLSEMLHEIDRKQGIRVKKLKRQYLNRLGAHIFERQKTLLPEMLESMKRARECLQASDDKLEANDCIDEINDFKSKMVKEDENDIDTWDSKAKNRILDEFDENIEALDAKMPCIRAAKNISDLSGCMRK